MAFAFQTQPAEPPAPVKRWLWIGSDPGLEGGMGFIASDGKRWGRKFPFRKVRGVQLLDSPVLTQVLREHQREGYTVLAAVEKPFLPKFNAGNLTTGRNWGLLIAAFLEAGVDPFIVEPKPWQKVVLAGIVGDDPKVRAKEFVQKNFPEVPLIIGKAKEEHDGIIDGLCIAEWCRRETGG